MLAHLLLGAKKNAIQALLQTVVLCSRRGCVWNLCADYLSLWPACAEQVDPSCMIPELSTVSVRFRSGGFISPAAELDGSCIEALGASQSSLGATADSDAVAWALRPGMLAISGSEGDVPVSWFMTVSHLCIVLQQHANAIRISHNYLRFPGVSSMCPMK